MIGVLAWFSLCVPFQLPNSTFFFLRQTANLFQERTNSAHCWSLVLTWFWFTPNQKCLLPVSCSSCWISWQRTSSSPTWVWLCSPSSHTSSTLCSLSEPLYPSLKAFLDEMIDLKYLFYIHTLSVFYRVLLSASGSLRTTEPVDAFKARLDETEFPDWPWLFSCPAGPRCFTSNWVVSLTCLCCLAGRVSGQSGEHLPFVFPAQPGPQEQDRLQLSARHDVCRYGLTVNMGGFSGSRSKIHLD